MNIPRKQADKAIAGLVAYESATKLIASSKDFWRRNFAFKVTVSERDVLYMDIHNWLLDIMPDERHKSLLVSSANGGRNGDPVPESEIKTTKPLVIRFNDKAPRRVMIDGHRVTVSLKIPEVVASNSDFREPEASTIEFVTGTYAGQQAIIGHLNRLNNERSTSRKAVLRMVGQWGSWKTRSDLPPRTLDSVSMPPEQKARIVADLETFLGAEDQYNRLAIPWHRGYMFHGPPGNGKTSLVKALAIYFNLDLWYISLADLKTESSLLGLLAEVGPRSMLLLEDIDTMKITQDRDGSEQGTISMSSLLNTLDGVATPHGLVSALTTNRFEVLDDALTRAGRMDLIEVLDYPTFEILGDLFQHFYGRKPSWGDSHPPNFILDGVSIARMAEVFKRHMSDPSIAESEITDLINKEVMNDSFTSTWR